MKDPFFMQEFQGRSLPTRAAFCYQSLCVSELFGHTEAELYCSLKK